MPTYYDRKGKAYYQEPDPNPGNWYGEDVPHFWFLFIGNVPCIHLVNPMFDGEEL